MRAPQTCNLETARRLINFPLPVHSVGRRPGNCFVHVQNRLPLLYLSFVFRHDHPSMVEVDGKACENSLAPPYMDYWLPGTVLNTLIPNRRDELFFTYDPALTGRFLDLKLTSCEFRFTAGVLMLLKRIRRLLRDIHSTGNADRLDQGVIALATEVMFSGTRHDAEKIGLQEERTLAVASFLENHFAEQLDMDALLTRHHLERRTFYRVWRKFFRETPHQFILSRRFNFACEMLASPCVRIYEVAEASGFKDAIHFNLSFKRRFSVSPGDYRKGILEMGMPVEKTGMR